MLLNFLNRISPNFIMQPPPVGIGDEIYETNPGYRWFLSPEHVSPTGNSPLDHRRVELTFAVNEQIRRLRWRAALEPRILIPRIARFLLKKLVKLIALWILYRVIRHSLQLLCRHAIHNKPHHITTQIIFTISQHFNKSTSITPLSLSSYSINGLPQLAARWVNLRGQRNINVRTERFAFRDFVETGRSWAVPKYVPRPIDNTPHPRSADHRARFCRALDAYAAECNRSVYHVSHRNSPRDSGHPGINAYYKTFDLITEHRCDAIPDRSIVALIDCDYYMSAGDLARLQLTGFKPVIIYRMFPRHATCSTGEFSYYFDDENYLNVHYQGSQSFRHKLWNFESDCVTCYDSVTGIFVAYSVERYRYDKIDREVVQLTPMYTTFSHSAARLVAEQPLVHFEPVVHGDKATWATWKVQTRSSNYRTVARTGQLAHADITTSLADVLNTSQDTAQRKISSFHVHDAMGRKDNDHHVIAAWIKDGAPNNKLEATLPLKTPLVKRETLSSDDESSDDDLDDDDAPSSSSTPLDYIPPSHDTTSPGGTVIHQLSTTELADEPPRPAMKQLGNPVTSANVYSPSTDRDSIVNTASSRIVPFLPKDNSINESLDPHIAAFIQYLAPESPNLMPHDIQMILDAQNRPAQKSLNDRILNGFSKPMSQLFTKGEVYSTPKDPRPITPLENIDRLFSATVYASASKWLSSLGWYASGLPPCKVAQSVAHVCNQARS